MLEAVRSPFAGVSVSRGTHRASTLFPNLAGSPRVRADVRAVASTCLDTGNTPTSTKRSHAQGPLEATRSGHAPTPSSLWRDSPLSEGIGTTQPRGQSTTLRLQVWASKRRRLFGLASLAPRGSELYGGDCRRVCSWYNLPARWAEPRGWCQHRCNGQLLATHPSCIAEAGPPPPPPRQEPASRTAARHTRRELLAPSMRCPDHAIIRTHRQNYAGQPHRLVTSLGLCKVVRQTTPRPLFENPRVAGLGGCRLGRHAGQGRSRTRRRGARPKALRSLGLARCRSVPAIGTSAGRRAVPVAGRSGRNRSPGPEGVSR